MAKITDPGELFVPTASTNGTEVANRPALTRGLRVYFGTNGVLSFYFKPVGFVPTGVQTNTVTLGPFTGGSIVDFPECCGNYNMFVTAITATVLAKWIANDARQ